MSETAANWGFAVTGEALKVSTFEVTCAGGARWHIEGTAVRGLRPAPCGTPGETLPLLEAHAPSALSSGAEAFLESMMVRPTLSLLFCTATVLIAPSCTQDFDKFEPVGNSPEAGAGGGSTGGAGGTGEQDAAATGGSSPDAAAGYSGGDAGQDAAEEQPSCGVAPDPTGGACPAQCTGGCDANVCKIACDDANPCDGQSLHCPSGFACDVQCSAQNACRDATITCPQTFLCTVSCSGASACDSATIECSTGVCSTACGAAPNSCKSTTVRCGQDQCAASCAGASKPKLQCGASCDCSPC